MEEIITWGIVIIAFVLLLPFIHGPLFTFQAVFSVFAFKVLDVVLGADLLPAAPWLIWSVWGALIGTALGFWTIAPVYGLRSRRRLIASAPFLLIALVALLRLICA